MMNLPTELPQCIGCDQLADPRWFYKGHMCCDGCCPNPGQRSERLDAVLRAEARGREQFRSRVIALEVALGGLIEAIKSEDICNGTDAGIRTYERCREVLAGAE